MLIVSKFYFFIAITSSIIYLVLYKQLCIIFIEPFTGNPIIEYPLKILTCIEYNSCVTINLIPTKLSFDYGITMLFRSSQNQSTYPMSLVIFQLPYIFTNMWYFHIDQLQWFTWLCITLLIIIQEWKFWFTFI